MGALATGTPRGIELDAAARRQLRARLTAAVRRARRGGGPVLAALTVPVSPEIDPTALVCASRRPDESWFALEQPDRGGAAIGSLGAVVTLQVAGPGRFGDAARSWAALAAHAVCDPPDGLAGSGPIAVGGFAFADEGARSPHWHEFGPASLVVGEVSIARGERDGRPDVRLTLSALAQPDDLPDDLLARLLSRVDELAAPSLPLLDPDPVGRFTVASAMPPEHYEEAVRAAVARIRSGEFEKIVLAREVQVHAPTEHDVAAVLGVLRDAFPSCLVFAVGRGDAALIAASPELLIRRQGMRVSTLSLAGSMRRSADPAVDDHLGEQLLRSAKDREEQSIVTRRIERALRPHAVWVASAPEPQIVRVANIQHLATPIRAQLSRPVPVLELAGLMHPTPAVGGEPAEVALGLIPALEGLDRGWYAGPVGWTDINGDGELAVALRCALLQGRLARCYAGVGVVRDSKPPDELAETELKLGALLPVLAG